MSRKMRIGAALAVLSAFLFFGCNTPLNEAVTGAEKEYQARAVGDILFSITNRGVTFTAVHTGANQVKLNMLNNQNSDATVTFTVNIYTYIGVLNNRTPRVYTLSHNVSLSEYFYMPTDGGILLTNITVKR